MARARSRVSLHTEALTADVETLMSSSWNGYIPFLSWLIAVARPTCAVEVGCGTGESFRPLCQAMNRFSDGGRTFGIDEFSISGQASLPRLAAHEALREYCETHFSGEASLVRLAPGEALAEFDDESIDLLHLTRRGAAPDHSPADLDLWRRKLRPGAIIMLTSADDDDFDGVSWKMWRQIGEHFPSFRLGPSSAVGIAQLPVAEKAPIVEFLLSDPSIPGLFRALGERIEFRHLLRSEPMAPRAVRHYLAVLTREHSEQIRQLSSEHREQMRGQRELFDALSRRSHEQLQRINSLEAESNLLLAKLAHYSARHVEEMAGLQRELDELQTRCATDIANLQAHLDDRRAQIEAIYATRSWKVTRPLRALEAVRLRIRSIRRRSG